VADPDFLYSRLKAKMLARQEQESGSSLARYKILRPVYALAVLLLVIVINATVLLSSGNKTEPADENENGQTVISEYNMNDNAILFDLNTDK